MACAQNIDLFQEQRRLQGQTMAEQEVLFGSKPSLLKIQSGKRSPRLSSGGGSNRGLSAAGTMPQTPKDDSLPSIKGTHNTHEAKKNTSVHTIKRTVNHPNVDAFAALSNSDFLPVTIFSSLGLRWKIINISSCSFTRLTEIAYINGFL